MTSNNSIQNWIDAKELFEQYLDQPVAQSLQDVKNDTNIPNAVKSILLNLIEAQSTDDTIIDQADLSFFHSIDNKTEDLSGKIIGDYRLIKRIGQGGMSNVYKAKRKGNDIQKLVALKLLASVEGKISDTLMILFEREQVTLSKLNHPNIISFHHGGISQNNIPFLVMDFIEEAKTINQYVIDKNLSHMEIIKLVKQVADAINFAHQNFIIHKDIKPNNVLIDQLGMPKVVDFGIASFDELETGPSGNLTAQIFTPDYASPEQIRNENITANSDIFSLAALLLELLSKQKPLPGYNGNTIDEEEYSQHIYHLLQLSNIPPDLQCILKKALKTNKTERYQSMLEFVEDLDAYLDRRPISARKQTKHYLITKYIYRNPGFSLAIFAFTISAIIGMITTVQQKNKAQLEALKSQQITNFLIDSIQVTDPDINKGKEMSVKELLLNAKINIQETSFQDQSLSTALEQTIGSALVKIGQYKEAEKLLQKAIQSDNNNFDARLSLANLNLNQKYFPQAQIQLDKLLANKNLLNQQQIVKSNQLKAQLLYNKGEFEPAIATIKKIMLMQELSTKQIIDNRVLLSKFLDEQGKFQQAIDELTQALLLSNNTFSETSSSSTNILFFLANIYTKLDQVPEERLHAIYSQTLRNQKTLYGDNHPQVAKTYLQYGFALKTFGEFQQSKEFALLARDIASQNFGNNHMLSAHIDLLISQLNLIDNNVQEATTQLENVVKVYAQHYGENHFETNQTKTTLAGYYLKANQGDKALNMLLPLYESQKNQLGESNQATIYVKMNILKAYNLSKQYEKAIEQGEHLLTFSQNNLGPESILTIGTQITLAESYLKNKHFNKSKKLSEELLNFDLIKNNPRYLQKVTELIEQANI